jgi:integrase/recombinase XerD
MFGNLPEERTSGPLFQFGAHFAEHLVARGHGRSHICNLKGLLRDLDQWLASEGLRAEDLRRSEIERFQADRVAAGRKILVSVRALTPLMEYLRGVGIEPQEPKAAADGPLAAVLQRYRSYLATERGLKRETAARYAAPSRPT